MTALTSDISLNAQRSSNPIADVLQPHWQDEVATESVDAHFSEGDVRSFLGNDAMAAGVIATILTLAFVTLLGLAIGVTVWTMGVVS